MFNGFAELFAEVFLGHKLSESGQDLAVETLVGEEHVCELSAGFIVKLNSQKSAQIFRFKLLLGRLLE